MSCGCTSTTTASSSVTCGSCGYQCTSCICPPDPIVMPTVTCSDPVECSEIYPAACIQYTGNDIKCSTTASSLYPNVTHIVAANGDMLPDILNNINNQLCYLFSADFIATILNVINNDTTLNKIFCSLTTDCTTPPPLELICPTVSSVTYNVNPTNGQNYLTAVFNYVPYATNYAYQFYVETGVNTGVYTLIPGCGGNIPQPSVALPISVSGLLTSTYTANKNYAVLVYATGGSYTPSGVNPADYPTTFTYSTVAASNLDNCGINQYTAGDTTQTCLLNPFTKVEVAYYSNVSTIQVHFQQQSQVPASNIPITKYKVHWYLEKTVGSNTYYDYLGSIDIPFNALQWETINLNKPVINTPFSKTGTTVTVTSPAHGLTNGTSINIPSQVGNIIPIGSYTIAVTNANTFTFTTLNSSSGSGSLTYCCVNLSSTDKVVVMIQTLTDDPTCFLGVSPRINGYFTPTEIITYMNNLQYQVYRN